jgi:hypothetical protein
LASSFGSATVTDEAGGDWRSGSGARSACGCGAMSVDAKCRGASVAAADRSSAVRAGAVADCVDGGVDWAWLRGC